MEASGQLYAAEDLSPEKKPLVYWMEGVVTVVKRNIFAPTGSRISDTLTVFTELSWLILWT
jgi:hypothetical protein